MILLLDLDGTLIDSFSRHGLLLEELLQQHAPGNHIQNTEYVQFKRSGKNNYQYLTQHLGLPEATARQICDAWVRQIEDSGWLQQDKLYDDTQAFLELVKAHGDKIIFLSARQNAANAYAELQRLGLDQYADDIIIVNQNAQYQTKKDYIQQLSLYQSPKSDIIIIGDTEDDFGAAQANQVSSFILNRGFRASEYLTKIGVPESFASLVAVSRRMYE